FVPWPSKQIGRYRYARVRILMHGDTQWTVSEVARSAACEFQFLKTFFQPDGPLLPLLEGANARMKRSLAGRDPPEHDDPAARLVLRVLRRSGSLPVHLAPTREDASDFGFFRCRPSGEIKGNRPAEIS